jgi:hypothetical protein
VSDHERIIRASEATETLSQDLHKLAEELKAGLEGVTIPYAYARLYHLRTRMGHIVGSLGVGLPKRRIR